MHRTKVLELAGPKYVAFCQTCSWLGTEHGPSSKQAATREANQHIVDHAKAPELLERPRTPNK